MDPVLGRLLIALTVVLAVVSAVLLTYAWTRTHRSSYDDFRRAAYLSALGDIATRSGYPPQLVRGWSRDRVFRATLVEYLTFLTGHERDNLLKAAAELEIIDHYIAALSSGRTRRGRVAAAEALGDLADPTAVGVLLGGLRDRVPEVRVQSAHALAAIRDPLTVGALLDALASEQEVWVAERLADALVAFESAAVLDTALRLENMDYDGDATPPWAPLATRGLGTIGDVRAQPALVRMLGAPDASLRQLAAESLGKCGTPEVVPVLIGALSDVAPGVRANAATALGRHLDSRSRHSLVAALDDQSDIVRRAAAGGLGALPDGENALVQALGVASPDGVDTIQDHLLTSGLYRKAIVRLRSGSATDNDYRLIDSLLESGKLERLETSQRRDEVFH